MDFVFRAPLHPLVRESPASILNTVESLPSIDTLFGLIREHDTINGHNLIYNLYQKKEFSMNGFIARSGIDKHVHLASTASIHA